MAEAFVIECEGIAAGLAVAERRGFRFHAADPLWHPLDRKAFNSLQELRKAVTRRMAHDAT